MEELSKLFPALIMFLVLGVPPIVYLFRLLIDEKTKNIERILTLVVDFQRTMKEMELTHSASDGKLLEAIGKVNSIAEKLLDRSKDA